MQIILASTSPYRQSMLQRLGLRFQAVPPVCDETPLPGETASNLAQRLAHAKAYSLAQDYPAALIIGSDQVASLDGQLIGKPAGLEQGVRMLQWMSGRCVSFYSAVALYNSATARWQEAMDVIEVTLRELSEEQIRAYLRLEPDALHCAGSAKSEGLGGVLLEKVVSEDPNALIGLPLLKLITMLNQEGVELLA